MEIAAFLERVEQQDTYRDRRHFCLLSRYVSLPSNNLNQKQHCSHHAETFKANGAHETFEANSMSHTCSRRIFTLSFAA
jgi:hypothetical protein